MGRVDHRRVLHPVAAAALLALAGTAAAQARLPGASAASELRYTPVQGSTSALHPRSDGAHRQGLLPVPAADGAAAPAPARLVVEADRDGAPADGQSAVRLTLRLYGADGAPLRGPTRVTIEHSGGRLLLPGAGTDEAGPDARDADRIAPGVQVQVVDGELAVALLAPHEPQDVRLRIAAGNLAVQTTLSFLPDLRPVVAAGLIEGVIGLQRRIELQPVRHGDAFEREIRNWSRDFDGGRGGAAARAALFLKGTVRGSVLLTAAYDSDKETRARLLRDIRPDELYPVYGDASLRSFDARSGSRLYLRLDSGKSYLLYGDFVTADAGLMLPGQGAAASLQQRSLGAYNRSATGLRLHHESAGLLGNAWVVHDSLRRAVQEFASQGSGPYALAQRNVLEGSEKIEMIVRDRQQPSRIVEVRPLVRLVDYSFEPFSGRILLAQFLPAVDADLNPVSLRVSYEVDQGGERFWAGGLDGQIRLGQAFELGGSVVQDRNPLARYDLASANASWRLGPRSTLVVEVARSQADAAALAAGGSAPPAPGDPGGRVSGQAWRVELVHEAPGLQLRGRAGSSDAGFHNPAAPLDGGRADAQLAATWRVADALDLLGHWQGSRDRNPSGGENRVADAALRWRASPAVTVEAGWRQRHEVVGLQASPLPGLPFGSTAGLGSSLGLGAGGGAVGSGVQPLDPATGLPLTGGSGASGPLPSTLPAGTRLDAEDLRLGLGWRVSPRLGLGAEVEQAVAGDDRRRYALGGDWRLGERARVYARWEQQRGWTQLQGLSATSNRASALAVGVDTQHERDTQLFSEMRLRDALGGREAQLASGARQQLRLAEGVAVSGGVERVQVLSGSSATASAVHAGLEYSAHALWRASTRLEWRRSADLPSSAEDERFDTRLWQALVARKLDRDWTLLARNHLLHTDYRSKGDVLQNRLLLGLAWRDTDTNRSNALARVELKHESDASQSATGELASRAAVVSMVAEHHPSRPWWLSGRAAAKWQRDRLDGGTASSFQARLIGARLTYDLDKRWDLSAAAAMQFGQSGARQSALGLELGYLVAANLWLSAGVNVSGFSADRDLAADEYTRRGAYLRLRFKFDETLFRAADRDLNRSLER